MGLFVKDGGMTVPGFLIMLGIPLLYSRWSVGLVLILVGFGFALRQVVDEIKEQDKEEIRFQSMSAADIGDALQAMNNVMAEHKKDRTRCLAALIVLAEKYNDKDQDHSSNQYHPHELECICQEAAYIVLGLYPQDDEAVAAAFSLNALVARDSQVRERLVLEANMFGVNVILQVMKSSLKRAQDLIEPREEEEQLSAQVQRKACLLLGGLADDDSSLATKIVDQGGLEAILNALHWYRCHDEVANWGLWAIFVLCYNHNGNKEELLRLGGIPIILQAIQHNPKTLQVSRHGIAILFDLLRETPQTPAHVAQLRKMITSACLHAILLTAMKEFNTSMDIMMMGQEMLLGTGYRGEMPAYQPSPTS
jgi:hypothetical protein